MILIFHIEGRPPTEAELESIRLQNVVPSHWWVLLMSIFTIGLVMGVPAIIDWLRSPFSEESGTGILLAVCGLALIYSAAAVKTFVSKKETRSWELSDLSSTEQTELSEIEAANPAPAVMRYINEVRRLKRKLCKGEFAAIKAYALAYQPKVDERGTNEQVYGRAAS